MATELSVASALQRNLADEAQHRDWEIESFTKRHAAVRIDGAAVDPKRAKILA